MNYLYSLYDALVSISVPADKARAVVDAMERDMVTALATKQDLEILRRDTENRFAMVHQRFDSLESQMDQKFGSLESRMDQKFDSLRSDYTRDIAALDLRMTIKLGSMLFVGFALMIAAMRVWS